MIIFGFRSYARLLAIITLVCSRCGNPAAHRVVQHTRKFTLFFIPLFPVSSSRSMTCTFCGAASRLSKEQAADLVANSTGAAPQPAVERQPTQQPPTQP